LSPDPGIISFEKRGILVKESVGKAQVPVTRKKGADGVVSVRWRTIGNIYLNCLDYKILENDLFIVIKCI